MQVDISLIKIASYISAGTSLMTMFISASNYKRGDIIIFPLLILAIVAGIVDVVSGVFVALRMNNSPIFHLFTVVEFSLISLFYYRFLKQYLNPYLIIFSIPVFLVAFFVDYKINGLDKMDNLSTSVESVILSFYSLFLFFFILRNLLFENLLGSSIFWFNVAVLFYFSGNLILFVFGNSVLNGSIEEHYFLWSLIHSFFNIVYNIFLSVGFWKTRVK